MLGVRQGWYTNHGTEKEGFHGLSSFTECATGIPWRHGSMSLAVVDSPNLKRLMRRAVQI
jgi:hypothetical protein